VILPLTVAALLAAPPVRVGLEQVEAQGGAPLKGKRIGLLAHAASVTADGRHAVDVLRGLGVDVRRLFAPEHGPPDVWRRALLWKGASTRNRGCPS